MLSTSLQRVTRQASVLVLGVLGTLLMSTSAIRAQTAYQITNSNGNVLPESAGLYTVMSSCQSVGTLPVTVCTWVLRKLYGDQSQVVVVADAPNGVAPGCTHGTTQQISSGYTRSGCVVYATSAVYGH